MLKFALGRRMPRLKSFPTSDARIFKTSWIRCSNLGLLECDDHPAPH